MRFIYLLFVLAFLLVVVIFAFQNFDAVTVSFLDMSVTAPLAALIVLIYVLGMFTGGGLISFLRHSIHKAAGRTAKRDKAPS